MLDINSIVILLVVHYYRSYGKGSVPQSHQVIGGIFYVKHAISNTSVTDDPEHNMKATKNFLHLILFAHVAATAKEVINSNDIGISCNEDMVAKFVKIEVPSDLPLKKLAR